MKIWLATLSLMFIFSGCTKSQNYRLRTQNTKQNILIQKQRQEINALRAQLKIKKNAIKKARTKNRIQRKNKVVHTPKLPQAPKKNIKLKRVEDSNYSSSYMYPTTKKKPMLQKKVIHTPVVTSPSSTTLAPLKPIQHGTMSKAECISMIGINKFTKYTQMFGSEAASLKRCKILKAMKQ